MAGEIESARGTPAAIWKQQRKARPKHNIASEKGEAVATTDFEGHTKYRYEAGKSFSEAF